MNAGLHLARTTNADGSLTGAALYETVNGGRWWHRVAASSLPLRQVTAWDDVSSTTAFTVAQVGGPRGIWETQDGGRTWSALKSRQ